jgi:FKBP-type peptidyl-prolyl cis-trans isomerase (trigger factor)
MNETPAAEPVDTLPTPPDVPGLPSPPDDVPRTISFEPEALPYRFNVVYPKRVLAEHENAFLAASHLPPPPPEQKMSVFNPLYRQLVEQAFQAHLFPREVMYLESFRYTETPATEETDASVTLGCRLYLTPAARFPNGVGGIEVVDRFPVTVDATEREVDQALARAQLARAEDGEKPRSPLGGEPVIEDGDVALVTIRTSIDGKPWPLGAQDKARLPVVAGQCHPDEFRQHLVGLGVGSHTLTFTLTDAFGPKLAGKKVSAAVTVHAILVRRLPAFDDAFAQAVGPQMVRAEVQTFAELRTLLYRAMEERLHEQWKLRIGQEAIRHLVARATFAPIPEGWIVANADQNAAPLLARNKDPEQRAALFKHFQVTDEEGLRDVFAQQARAQAEHLMALLGYAEVHQIPRPPGPIGDYLAQILDHLVDHVRLVRPPVRLESVRSLDVAALAALDAAPAPAAGQGG